MAWLLGLGATVLFAPNTHEIMAKHPIALAEVWDDIGKWQQRLQWSNGEWGVVLSSGVFCSAVISITKAAQLSCMLNTRCVMERSKL
jgi:hypothetical protein